MIQKLSDPGAGFRGALNYALAAKKQPELIAGNMGGESARELAKEFGEGRALTPAVQKPVFHGSLTAPSSDQLSEEQWRRIAELYLERLGYGGFPGGGGPPPATGKGPPSPTPQPARPGGGGVPGPPGGAPA